MTQYQIAVSNLKKVFKLRGIHYRELAVGLKISESGLKKILAAKDGSFERLNQMCRYTGVHLREILLDPASEEVEFPPSIQSEFSKNFLLFSLYWHLVYERKSMDMAKERFGLSDTQVFKLARKLDHLKLIKLLPGDRLRIPTVRPVRWVNQGAFIRKLYQEWSVSMIKKLSQKTSHSDDFFTLRYLKIRPSTYQEFASALSNLEAEFQRRTIQEMQENESELIDARFILGMDQQSFLETSRLKTIES